MPMSELMKKTRTYWSNAGLSLAILIGLIVFKRFAVRVRIEVTEVQPT